MNAKSLNGRTALHEACLCENESMVSLLIRKGAKVTPADGNFQTPLACLMLEREDRQPTSNANCKIAIIKELAKLVIFKQNFTRVDLNLIKSSKELQEHLRNCVVEFCQMYVAVFSPPYSYGSILKMSKNLKKLAKLTMNEEFVEKFERNLAYPYYGNDLQWILDEAMQIRDRSIIVYFRLIRIFGDIFPELVIDKFTENLAVEDLPTE